MDAYFEMFALHRAGTPFKKSDTVQREQSGWPALILIIMVVINAFGLFMIFGDKTYAEANVMGQLANILSRTNGLLLLMLANQMVFGGALLFRR